MARCAKPGHGGERPASLQPEGSWKDLQGGTAGSQIWEKRYDNFKNGQISSDGADKIITDNDGNLFVMGVSDNDYLLVSYNSAGSINYEYRFNGPCNGLEEPKDMCFAGNNTIAITGMSEHYTENTDICTIKIANLVTAVNNQPENVPSQFSLSQNYPNPFNPSTNISFSIPKAGHVKLVVYDLTGKQVAELVNGTYNAGTHEVKFDSSKLSSGTYFYRIITDSYTDTKKMTLIK